MRRPLTLDGVPDSHDSLLAEYGFTVRCQPAGELPQQPTDRRAWAGKQLAGHGVTQQASN